MARQAEKHAILSFKRFYVTFVAACVALVVSGEDLVPWADTVKVAWFDEIISPEVGVNICGYGPGLKSVGKTSELHAIGCAIDDGERRTLVISCDLLGLDHDFLVRTRTRLAKILGASGPEAVMISCTHTHGGPETYWQPPWENRATLEETYLKKLEETLVRATTSLSCWHTCKVAYYSMVVDENRNRRYVTGENQASFTPHRKEMERLAKADRFADKELGVLMFIDTSSDSDAPLYLIGNYAAHPLASHAPGKAGLMITSDYPGYFRDYIESETGCKAMFISGAAGDLVPKGDEMGSDSARQTGVNLAKGAFTAIIDTFRNPTRFVFKKPKTGATSRRFTCRVRGRYRKNFYGSKTPVESIEMEVQVISVGDVCFVGVPGEVSCELGQEIKWHSPFRRAWIGYMATGSYEYQSEPNALIAGGYEPKWQLFEARHGLKLVAAAEDAMFALRENMFPEDSNPGDPYPDNLDHKLVNIHDGKGFPQQKAK